MNNIYKNIAFLLILATAGVFAETVEELDEGKSLNEMIRRKMLGSDDTPFSFCGDLNLTALFISQDKSEGYDDSSASLQGNIGLVCAGKGNGFGYGAEIGVKTDSGLIKQGAAIMKTAFIFAEFDKIGTIRLGYTNTAADLFSICGDRYLVGYGGAGSGNLGIFYNKSAGSIVDTGFAYNDSRAAKILWLSPTFSGFSVGLSFTPDSRDANLFRTRHCLRKSVNEKSCFSGISAYAQNTITGGIAYEWGAPDDFNVKISAAGWFGRGKSGSSDSIKVHDVCAYNIGAIFGYKDFKISLGYTDAGKSLLPKKYATADMSATFDDSRDYSLSDPEIGLKPGANAGKIYSIGVAYTYKKLTVSAGYFKSEVRFSHNEKSTADIVTFAAEYTFDKIVGVYVEYDYISSNSCARARAYGKACDLSSTGKNRANVLMVGTKINI